LHNCCSTQNANEGCNNDGVPSSPGRYAVIGCKLKQNANEGYNSCASLAGLVLCFIACFILLVIAPILDDLGPRCPTAGLQHRLCVLCWVACLLVMGKSIRIDSHCRIVMKNFDSVPQLQRFSYVHHCAARSRHGSHSRQCRHSLLQRQLAALLQCGPAGHDFIRVIILS